MAELVARVRRKPVVCVFCGASTGTSPQYVSAARSLARALHDAGLNLVYGGGTVGLMGEIARTLVALAGPDSVHGIIPEPLVELENADPSSSTGHCITEAIYGRTTIVGDMHTRKKLMAKEVIEGGPGGGFVALPGGYGTFEELMEITTWNQLGIHSMPIVVYSVDDYWGMLIRWVRAAVAQGFVEEVNANIIREARNAKQVMKCLASYQNAGGRQNLAWAMSKL
ncbi:lysine decarboxylase-like protein [Stemphylium lycopersici]|uniref:Lysine decarboxylase-like protein n=1 Tax=Stemphylium lycopersici TaxID=183478 RepID=A0A364MRN5_STELY|nr:lysine decarboxylase-like protein [Stemphylium lycopersici]RAQ98748.1 lysine decarboxylase-like protein [Stemphylium lycopersici]RAR01003.1 lysine decarboxylase-like protein [Stemphylium lycopersici]